MKKINIKNNTNELFSDSIIQENNERNTKRFFTKFGVFFIACLFASIITIFADGNPDANDDENDNIRECSITISTEKKEYMNKQKIKLTGIVTNINDYPITIKLKAINATLSQDSVTINSDNKFNTEATIIYWNDVNTKTKDIKITASLENQEEVKVEITVKAYNLLINHFKDTATGKEWKICIGDKIKYEANATDDCIDWKWEMPSWEKTKISEGKQKNGSDMLIKLSILSTAKNSDFGENRGVVKVSCKDFDGNNYEFISQTKANVFFPMLVGRNNQTAALSSTNPPCWFYFFKTGNVVEGMGNVEYKNLTDNVSIFENGKIFVGNIAIEGNKDSFYLRKIDGITTFKLEYDIKNLDNLAYTIAHEEYHKLCYDNGWEAACNEIMYSDANNMMSHKDSDALPNAEENSPSEIFFYQSKVDDYDTFQFDNSLDYADQEVRAIQYGLERKKKRNPEKDWSNNKHNPKW